MEHIRAECKPCLNCYKRGCRCLACRRENNEYEYEQKKKRKDPSWNNSKVSSSRARNHLIFLASKGVGIKHVSKISGVSHYTLFEVRAARRKTIHKQTETKILGVPGVIPEDDKSTGPLRTKLWNEKQGRKSRKEGRDKRDSETGQYSSCDDS